MKLLHLFAIISIFVIYQSCAPAKDLHGTFTNAVNKIPGGESFKFSGTDNIFEYHSQAEGAVRGFSRGSWLKNGKIIFLNGFDKGNLNVLNVESKIDELQNENSDKIVIQYQPNPLDQFTIVEVVINKDSKFRIQRDTAFSVDQSIKIIQVKSFLSYEGVLFAYSPHLDTLYSKEIQIDNPTRKKHITLKVKVDQKDFYRVSLADTLFMNSARTFIWRRSEFTKIRR